MRRIRLSDGGYATVDEKYHQQLIDLGPWHPHSQGYASTGVYDPQTQQNKTLLMHVVVGKLAALCGRLDHRNGRKRDNRVKNLRSANHQQNNRNKGKQANNTSGYKGVSWSKATNKWTARIHTGTEYKHLGLFTSKRDAAKAYDEAARYYHGPFAKTNFP